MHVHVSTNSCWVRPLGSMLGTAWSPGQGRQRSSHLGVHLLKERQGANNNQ